MQEMSEPVASAAPVPPAAAQGALVAQTLERPLRPGEVSLDEVSALLDEHGDHATDWSARVEEDPAIQTDLRMMLTTAISELPADYRAVFLLRDVEGLGNDEISAALGISVAIAKTRAHRARLFLRKRLATSMSSISATLPAACERMSA